MITYNDIYNEQIELFCSKIGKQNCENCPIRNPCKTYRRIGDYSDFIRDYFRMVTKNEMAKKEQQHLTLSD